MENGVSTDVIRRIYDDKTGAFIDVRPDSDALNLVEIISGEDPSRCIILTIPMARAVSSALSQLAAELSQTIIENNERAAL